MNASTIAATALAGVLREHRIAGAFAGHPVRGPRTLTLALQLRNTGDLNKLLALDEAVAMRKSSGRAPPGKRSTWPTCTARRASWRWAWTPAAGRRR